MPIQFQNVADGGFAKAVSEAGLGDKKNATPCTPSSKGSHDGGYLVHHATVPLVTLGIPTNSVIALMLAGLMDLGSFIIKKRKEGK